MREIGQMLFANNTMYSYDCEDYIVALLRNLDDELCRVMWNKNQEEYESPFQNTGNSFIGKNFEVHAYSWDDESDQTYNFKCGNIEISWYKYLGRGTTINGNYSKDEIISMYNACLKEIREIDDEHYLKFA